MIVGSDHAIFSGFYSGQRLLTGPSAQRQRMSGEVGLNPLTRSLKISSRNRKRSLHHQRQREDSNLPREQQRPNKALRSVVTISVFVTHSFKLQRFGTPVVVLNPHKAQFYSGYSVTEVLFFVSYLAIKLYPASVCFLDLGLVFPLVLRSFPVLYLHDIVLSEV